MGQIAERRSRSCPDLQRQRKRVKVKQIRKVVGEENKKLLAEYNLDPFTDVVYTVECISSRSFLLSK